MSNRDLASDINIKATGRSAIGSNTTTLTTAVDTSGYSTTTFCAFLSAWTDGAYAVTIVESDASGGTYNAVDSAQLIGDAVSLGTAVPTLGTSNLAKLGCFGTKRWVKLSIVSTGVNTGAVIQSIAIQTANVKETA